jgi:hypothetical protein
MEYPPAAAGDPRLAAELACAPRRSPAVELLILPRRSTARVGVREHGQGRAALWPTPASASRGASASPPPPPLPPPASRALASIPLGAPLPEGSFPRPQRRSAGWRSKGDRRSWRNTRCHRRSWRNTAGPGRRGVLSAVRVGLPCSRGRAGGNTTGPGQAPGCDDAGVRTRPTGGSGGGGLRRPTGRRRRSSSVEHRISSSRRRQSSSVEHRTTEAAAPSRGGRCFSLAPRAPPASGDGDDHPAACPPLPRPAPGTKYRPSRGPRATSAFPDVHDSARSPIREGFLLFPVVFPVPRCGLFSWKPRRENG